MTATPPTEQQLDEIAAKAAELRERLDRKNPWPSDNESYFVAEGWKDGTRNALDKLDPAGLVAEVRRLQTALAKEERQHGDTIDDRDRAQDAADKLAYAVAPEDVIGEHTADNSPWANALDLISSTAEVDKLRDRVAELEAYAYGCDAEGCVLPHSSWCDAAQKTAAANDGCTCGKPWTGHPQPHAMHCWTVNPPRAEVEEMRKRIAELTAEVSTGNTAPAPPVAPLAASQPSEVPTEPETATEAPEGRVGDSGAGSAGGGR